MLVLSLKTTGGLILLDHPRGSKHLPAYGSTKVRGALRKLIRSQVRHAL